jgi:hypothetical protein
MMKATRSNAFIPVWLTAIILIGTLLIAAGGAIAPLHPEMLTSPHEVMNGAVHVYASYLASRNISIAIMLIALLLIRARRALSQLMVLVALVQGIDACMDCLDGRSAIVPGILVFGALFLVGAAKLCGYPCWKANAWIDSLEQPAPQSLESSK